MRRSILALLAAAAFLLAPAAISRAGGMTYGSSPTGTAVPPDGSVTPTKLGDAAAGADNRVCTYAADGTVDCTGTLLTAADVQAQALTATTANHWVYDTGFVVTATATQLNDGGKAWTVNGFSSGYCVRIVAGTGVTASCVDIASNTATQLTVSAWAAGTPDSTSIYAIVYQPDTIQHAMDWVASHFHRIVSRFTGTYYAIDYVIAGGSTTCGLQEAYANLLDGYASHGGIIVAAPGVCTQTTTFSLGGLADAGEPEPKEGVRVTCQGASGEYTTSHIATGACALIWNGTGGSDMISAIGTNKLEIDHLAFVMDSADNGANVAGIAVHVTARNESPSSAVTGAIVHDNWFHGTKSATIVTQSTQGVVFDGTGATSIYDDQNDSFSVYNNTFTAIGRCLTVASNASNNNSFRNNSCSAKRIGVDVQAGEVQLYDNNILGNPFRIDSGTATAGSGVGTIVIAGKNWPDLSVGYCVIVSSGTGADPGTCIDITSNTADTLTVASGTFAVGSGVNIATCLGPDDTAGTVDDECAGVRIQVVGSAPTHEAQLVNVNSTRFENSFGTAIMCRSDGSGNRYPLNLIGNEFLAGNAAATSINEIDCKDLLRGVNLVGNAFRASAASTNVLLFNGINATYPSLIYNLGNTMNTSTGTYSWSLSNGATMVSPGKERYDSIILCGQLVSSSTTYLGPGLATYLGAPTDLTMGGTACDALDNTTEATARAVVFPNTAMRVTGMYCKISSDPASDVVFSARAGSAELAVPLTCTIAGTGAAKECSANYVAGASPLVAANAAIDVKVITNEDLSAQDAWCKLYFSVQ